LTAVVDTVNISVSSLRMGEEREMTATRRRATTPLLVVLGLAWAAAACTAPAAAPPSGDPANGVTIDNASGSAVKITYELPDGATEPVIDLQPGQHAVVDAIFAGRDGLCRTGRFVASTADGAEIDELYLVCRGREWTVEAPGGS
jgi:hypothetical protein